MVPPVSGASRNRETMFERHVAPLAQFVKRISIFCPAGHAGGGPPPTPGRAVWAAGRGSGARSGNVKACRTLAVDGWFQRRRLRATSARPCSSANRVFFEAEALATQEQPDSIVGNYYPARSQFVLQAMQCQMRCLSDPLDYELSMRFQNGAAVASHLTRSHTASRTITLRPLHHRRYSHAEPLGDGTAAVTSANRINHPFAKIIGISSCHACWPPFPACTLNHKSTKM